MTLLTAINRAQRRLSLAVTSIITADGQETQNLLWELANTEAEEVLQRFEYRLPLIDKTHTFTATTGATLQTDGKPSNFMRMAPDTIWNRSTDRPIAGPLDEREWAIANGEPITTAATQYAMLRSDGLHIWPEPTVADTIAYEHRINTPVLAVDGVTYKTGFTANTDSYLFGDRLLILGVVWRYKKDKGRDYAEDMKDYEMALGAYSVGQSGARRLTLAPPDDVGFGMGHIPETGFTGAS